MVYALSCQCTKLKDDEATGRTDPKHTTAQLVDLQMADNQDNHAVDNMISFSWNIIIVGVASTNARCIVLRTFYFITQLFTKLSAEVLTAISSESVYLSIVNECFAQPQT